MMLKIQSWSVGLQRNAVSGVVEYTSSSTVSTLVPETVPVNLKSETTPDVPMELPPASQTRNLAGTVLPFLNTLVPSALMGCRIVCPTSPRHAPVLYNTLIITFFEAL